MNEPFKLLKISALLFKVIAWFVLILMAVGIVALLIGSDAQAPLPVPVLLNMVFSGLVGFLLFFALGEIVRVLLAIEANTRKT
jgi:hypothetical protein